MKTIHTGIAAGALFLVAACGNDADTLSDARETINTADTLQSTSEITLDFQAPEGTDTSDPTATIGGMLDVANDVSMSLDLKSDNVNKQHEMTVGINIASGDAANMSFDVPLFMDEASESVYIPAQTAADFAGMLMMPIELPAEHADKVIDLSDTGDAVDLDLAPEEEGNNLESLTPLEANEIMQGYLDQLPEDTLVVDGDTYTQTFNGNSFIEYMMKELQSREYITAEDLESFKDEVSNNISIGDVVVTSKVVDGNITSDVVALPITALTDGEPNGTLTVNVATDYTAINEDIEFNMNVSEDNVLSPEELESIMQYPVEY